MYPRWLGYSYLRYTYILRASWETHKMIIIVDYFEVIKGDSKIVIIFIKHFSGMILKQLHQYLRLTPNFLNHFIYFGKLFLIKNEKSEATITINLRISNKFHTA